jgi:pimeloyl-ACP methyl ester carboxylesterase
MADDMIELLKHLKWEDTGCHLFGFSLGGMVSLETALHRPDLFKSVILISTHAGGILGTVLPPWGIMPFLRTFSNLGSVDALDRGMELLHTTQYLDSDVTDLEHEKIQKIAREVLGTNDRVTNRFKFAVDLIHQARKYIEGGVEQEIRLEGTMKQISAAITHYVGWNRLNFLRVSGIEFLVIAGMHDNLVNYLNAGMLADALSAPLILKEDAGHGVNLHYADEINRALVSHVEKAQTKKLVEGRRAPSARSGVPPGIHPWMTSLIAFLPAYLLARRISSSSRIRRILVIIIVSLTLRLTHGPMYRVRNDF